jgi:hypothetical protein
MGLRAKPPKKYMEGGDLLIYEEPIKKHNYIMTVDVSKGRGQDYSTFNLIDISVRPFKQVAVYRNNTISPLLFPNIIYKYAKSYNNAYVVIESNDQGSLVCNGLYQDLEYENVHVESAIKANAVGVEMTRKTKRLGCSAIKDILENNKLEIIDENTILEISTFIAKGQSNLVMFGYFSSSQYFGDMTDINLKDMIFKKQMKEIEDDIVPFGFIDDASDEIERLENEGKYHWQVEYDPNF